MRTRTPRMIDAMMVSGRAFSRFLRLGDGLAITRCQGVFPSPGIWRRSDLVPVASGDNLILRHWVCIGSQRTEGSQWRQGTQSGAPPVLLEALQVDALKKRGGGLARKWSPVCLFGDSVWRNRTPARRCKCRPFPPGFQFFANIWRNAPKRPWSQGTPMCSQVQRSPRMRQ
jgi:hypothetical protein